MEAAAQQVRYEASVQAAETLRQQQLQELQQENSNQKIGEGVEKMNQLASAANNAAAAAAEAAPLGMLAVVVVIPRLAVSTKSGTVIRLTRNTRLMRMAMLLKQLN